MTIDKIQRKVVLREYRKLRSRCARYDLVNQNPEPFEISDLDSSEDEGAEIYE